MTADWESAVKFCQEFQFGKLPLLTPQQFLLRCLGEKKKGNVQFGKLINKIQDFYCCAIAMMLSIFTPVPFCYCLVLLSNVKNLTPLGLPTSFTD